jgi:hypothetical protein
VAVPGVSQPVLAKHSTHFSLQNAISIGVDEMQRNFDPMRKQIENWKKSQLSDAVAKLLFRTRSRTELHSSSRTRPEGMEVAENRVLYQSLRRITQW